VITIIDGEGGILRTPALLLSLPTPDFSMPYNVIILSSTVIALAFGSVFNILVRRFIVLEPGGVVAGNKLHGLILRLLAFVNTWVQNARAKKMVKKIAEKDGEGKDVDNVNVEKSKVVADDDSKSS
jgi:hypothetical protein